MRADNLSKPQAVSDNQETHRLASPQEPGSPRDALAVPIFRRVFIASFLSNIGRWMQNVALGVFAYEMTGEATFTTTVIGAQMFPMLVLGLGGGALADRLDRRKLLIITQTWQALLSVWLAFEVIDGDISRGLLLGIVFLMGVGQALYAPAFGAVLPSLVGPRNLSASISLNSASINGSRVIGPAIGAFAVSRYGISNVFFINAASYLFVIGALAVSPLPTVATNAGASMKERVFGGLMLARRSQQVGRPLLVMLLFSVLCLPFIGLMPVTAERNLGVDAKSQTYGNLYAAFGLGALLGALSVGTVLLKRDKPTVVRTSLALFGASLAIFASLDGPLFAYPVLFLVGLFYFTMPTALSTYLQEHIADEVRGRVMALWTISFGGVISITNLLSGRIVDATSVSTVLYGGAIAAIVLAAVVRLDEGPIAGEELLDSTNDAETASFVVSTSSG